MTAKQIVNIVLRLVAAKWVLGTMISLPDLLQFASTADATARRVALGSAIGNLVWLIIGALMFFKSERIAEAMFPDVNQLAISATSEELQQVGFSLLAVYFGLGAVARLAGLTYLGLRHEPRQESELGFLWRTDPERLASVSIQLLACIALFFGSKGLSTLWQRMRGRRPALPPE